MGWDGRSGVESDGVGWGGMVGVGWETAALLHYCTAALRRELNSTQVRNRLRGADDVVRYGLRKGPDETEKRSAAIKNKGSNDHHAWYDEAEGLVPPSVLAHIVRYGLYARD